ncbi:MAG: ImmA/IrrE family metallo-endopeptidase [Firmicutes bacterium]|nr:ImmA/IrrE family metallo-endopeptidase [Bacillota bacterium]
MDILIREDVFSYREELINDLSSIANLMKLRMIQAVLGSEGLSGLLLYDRKRALSHMIVNENDSDDNKIFTIGHEIGHFVLHKEELLNGKLCSFTERIGQLLSNNGDDALEKEADEFSEKIIQLLLAIYKRRSGTQ